MYKLILKLGLLLEERGAQSSAKSVYSIISNAKEYVTKFPYRTFSDLFKELSSKFKLEDKITLRNIAIYYSLYLSEAPEDVYYQYRHIDNINDLIELTKSLPVNYPKSGANFDFYEETALDDKDL